MVTQKKEEKKKERLCDESFTFTYSYPWGSLGHTDNFTTSFLHSSLFSTALWDLANSRPVHSLMLSSNLFFFPFAVCLVFLPLSPCLARWFLARPDARETCPYTTSAAILVKQIDDTCTVWATQPGLQIAGLVEPSDRSQPTSVVREDSSDRTLRSNSVWWCFLH